MIKIEKKTKKRKEKTIKKTRKHKKKLKYIPTKTNLKKLPKFNSQ